MVETRVGDTRFVLDQLATGRGLPEGLGRALDLERVGMYGHSGGGATAAEAMREELLDGPSAAHPEVRFVD
ncbi:hypothetical protein ACW23B_26315 [Streptomyces albidoflavus]